MSQPIRNLKTTQPSALSESAAGLLKVPFFRDLENRPEALEELFSYLEVRTVPVGEVIIREGDSGDEFFILVGGTAAVSRRTPEGDEYRVALLDGKGSVCFGEGCLISSDQRSATIRSETECLCWVLKQSDFMKFSENHPEWALPIYRRIAVTVVDRMRKTSSDVMLLYQALVQEIRGSG